MRNARRAGVEIQALIEGGLLRWSGLLAGLAAPHGKGTTAEARASFENVAVVAELSQFIGRRQPGDSGPEDDDARAAWRAPDRRRP